MMKTKLNLYDNLAPFAALPLSIYYGIYFILCLCGADTLQMAAFAVIIILVFVLPIALRSKLRIRLGSFFKPLWIVFTVLLCIYLSALAVFWCYIGLNSSKDSEELAVMASELGDCGNDTLVIVFGSRIVGDSPGDNLKLRLDEAYSLLKALPESQCIVSGGQGPNEQAPEAVVMKEYLVDRGISADRIIEEAVSGTTSENIRFSMELVNKLGIEYDRIIGVSNAFHLPRIDALAKRYWQPIELCAAPSPNPALYFVSMVREFFSYFKMMFFDKLVIKI